MKKAFVKHFLLLLYVELVFHFACFHSIDLVSIVFISISSAFVSGFITSMLSLIKKDKTRKIITRIMMGMIVVLYVAELVYFSIYESFFSFNGVQFAGALVGGYDKVISTLFHNMLYVLLLIVPVIIFVIKMPKYHRNNLDSTLILYDCMFFLLICICTSSRKRG